MSQGKRNKSNMEKGREISREASILESGKK
jgi:hypothetical protein